MSNQENSLEKLLPMVNPILNKHTNLFPLAAVGLDEQTLQIAKMSVNKIAKSSVLPYGVKIFVVQDKKDEINIKTVVEEQINNLYLITKNIN